MIAPGAAEAVRLVQRDPLRLAQLLFQEGVGSGFRTQPDGSFSTDDGLARLVLVIPRGQALRGRDAKAFVRDASSVLAHVREQHPNVRLGLTGGHAIAHATEQMLIADLTRSGVLSLLLAALAFAVTFRRLHGAKRCDRCWWRP